ncbi:hypothetical protein BDV93DRAFT_571899 [Ceratobasidium sp. AG-I]|nr:hypothetical protein BDV93DRAFT_571899 [Ceratobasidium sp. AG-I]
MSITRPALNSAQCSEGSKKEPEYPTFQPPPEGDQLLESSDGHAFRVHSLLLSLASPIFREIFRLADFRDTALKLTQDKEALSIVLEYIYPGKPLVVNTLPHIRKGLSAAKSYDIKGLTFALNEHLCRYMKCNSTSFDPLEVWDLASDFELIETREVAARLVTIGKRDFRRPKALAELAREYPEASALVRLVGSQGVRAKALTDVLFAFHRPPMSFLRNKDGSINPPRRIPIILMCPSCTTKIGSCGPIIPTWIVWWAHAVYEFLLCNTLEAGSHLFEPAIMWNHSACCTTCISSLMCDDTQRRRFVIWAGEVKAELALRLCEAESL